MPKKKRLNQKAMLVNFQIAGWCGRVKDKKVSMQVIRVKHAHTDCGAWWTYLIPESILKDFTRIRNKCRNTYYYYTLPWEDGGCRILPSAMFMDYTKAMRKVTGEYDTLVQKFIKEYPTIVSEAESRLGKLYHKKKLPPISEIASKFFYRQTVFPLPDASDFRVDLDEDDIENIRQQVKDSINDTTKKAVTSIWDKLTDLIVKIEETLKEPKKVFRDTLISNLSDFCTLLPKFNITDDAGLEMIRKEAVKKLTNLRPDALRDDKQARRAGHKVAKDVLRKIKAFKKI